MSDNLPMDARITFRIPSSLRSALKSEAKRDKRTLSNLVILLLEKALKHRQEQQTTAEEQALLAKGAVRGQSAKQGAAA